MKTFLCLVAAVAIAVPGAWAQNPLQLASPDGRLTLTIELKDKIYYSVALRERPVVAPSPISLTLEGGRVLGANPKLRKATPTTIVQSIQATAYKRATISDRANELQLDFGDYAVHFRAYSQGVAYRFATQLKGQVRIMQEEFSLRFNEDPRLTASLLNNFWSSYEQFYERLKLSELPSGKHAYLPVLAQLANGISVGLTESDLYDYPALYVAKHPSAPHALAGVLPAYPTKEEIGGHNNFGVKVLETAPYLAEVAGTRTYPWRVLVVADRDHQLLDQDLVYQLARPATGDFSWVKPGKVAWDWWCDNHLYQVPFQSGINMDTYKYFIDFASAHGIEYINLDEGWSDQFDLTKLRNNIDVPELVRYGKAKNVGVILWCVWHVLDRQLAQVMPLFEQWGVAGLKVDFMDRDDQKTMNFYHRLATECAKHKLLVNFHGATKPTGMNRAYPNIINHEGVRGLEYNKFSTEGTTPDHAATIPFVRMLAGYMDYTPGAMHNAQKKDFRSVFSRPMSMGTRAHQMGLYVVLEAPLLMLSDSPTEYAKEKECLEFMAGVPTTFDQTAALDGKMGQYAMLARQKGRNWYLGAISNWEAREVLVNCSFLGAGSYQATVFSDGPNADRTGNDYQKTTVPVTASTVLRYKLAPGGGLAIKFTADN
jgi:alpha-glucosidase